MHHTELVHQISGLIGGCQLRFAISQLEVMSEYQKEPQVTERTMIDIE
jgi:hypothetical protein